MRRTTRNRRGAIRALVATGALLAFAFQAAPASADQGSSAVPSRAAASADAQQRAGAYWTADRMRQAAPLDLLDIDRKAAEKAGGAVPSGEKSAVAPTEPKAGAKPPAFPQPGGAWSGGGDVVKTSGRVFFTYQGRNASCSGDAVTSDNASTVITAGHCVKLDGAWHTNWVFVPGYHDGQAPYGRWTAAKTLTTPQWEASEDMNYDVGAGVVNPLDGKKLTDVVGGQGLSFNGGYNKEVYSFGFPAADPYDGESLTYCSGTSFQDFLLSKDHGLSCNMTGGSSGGPWFTDFDESTGKGLQMSVNSFGYTFLPDTMFGPYFGDDAEALYKKAQSS